MTFPVNGPVGVYKDMETVDDTQKFALGTRCRDSAGQDRMYVKSDAAITANSCIHIDESFKANMITSALALVHGKIGVAPATVSVSSNYFWACLSLHNTGVRVLGSCAKDVALYTTDTAGALDDSTASASQRMVVGVALTTTVGSTATVGTGVSQGELSIRFLAA